MNLSRIFILRPVATSLLMVAVLIAGLLAYRWLPTASGWPCRATCPRARRW